MKAKRKSDGATLHAAQWQPGLDHPAVTHEYPPTRRDVGGSADVRGFDGSTLARPGDWLISEGPEAPEALVVSQERFKVEYDLAGDAPRELSCPIYGGAACLGDRCAWWHHVLGRCAVFGLVDVLQAFWERGRTG